MNARPVPALRIEGLSKRFVLHNQGGMVLDVLTDVDLIVAAGECVVLHGPSGVGKSSLLRCIYGNYRSDAGQILIRHNDGAVNIATAEPRHILDIRSQTLGYVSQFLRVVPRVSALDVVAEPLRRLGVATEAARRRAVDMLKRLVIPERLWDLAPATFSGGEQQRINIARGFIVDYPILLLDEPTSALDAANRERVVDLIRDRSSSGRATLGIFHDSDVRGAVATRIHPMTTAGAA